MDYKTDKQSDTAQLARMYHTQLELYKEALERILRKDVEECYLYSFFKDREVPVSQE